MKRILKCFEIIFLGDAQSQLKNQSDMLTDKHENKFQTLKTNSNGLE